MIYLFSLGRTYGLCLAELQALLKMNKIDYKILQEIENHVIIEVKSDADCGNILKQSGGIVKIALFRGTIAAKQSFEREQIASLILPVLRQGYKNFGVSLIGFQDNIVKICEELKKNLKMHYILPKAGYELSSAQVVNRKVLEICIVKYREEFVFFQTLAVQNPYDWTKKDAGRPCIDDRLGMLPLKVARMMVNIGLGGVEGRGGVGEKNDKMLILDPFCGMGSILQEAIDLGFKNVVGGDIRANVLSKCRKNLEWFINKISCQRVNMMLINSDAANISSKFKVQNPKLYKKVDLIVTEPFLGDAKKVQSLKNKMQNDKEKFKTTSRNLHGDVNKLIHNIIVGLEKMYTGSLKDWRKILKPAGAICIIVPEIEVGKRVYTIPFVEICGKTGYNIVAECEYSREKAVVRREIYLLKNQKSKIKITDKKSKIF